MPLSDLHSPGMLRLRHNRLPEVAIPIHRERWSFYLDRLQAAAPGQRGPSAALS
jgi:hypothetical protein